MEFTKGGVLAFSFGLIVAMVILGIVKELGDRIYTRSDSLFSVICASVSMSSVVAAVLVFP